MSFVPIKTDGRCSLGIRLGYSVRPKSERATARLRMSIAPEYVRKAGWTDGELVRLDADATGGRGRLMSVQSAAGARKLVVHTGTRRGALDMPWTGDVPLFFPAVPVMTALEVEEVKAGEIYFALPIQAKAATEPAEAGTTNSKKGERES